MTRTARPGPVSLGLALLGLAGLFAALGAAAYESIGLGIGGKQALALGDLVLDRRATYAATFALAALALVAGLLVLSVRRGGGRSAILTVLAIAAGAIPAHFAAVGGNRLARVDGLDGDARAYVERPATAYADAEAIRTLIDLPDAAAAAERRRALIGLIWKADALPADLPARVEAGIADPTGGRLKSLGRATRLTIPMELGFAAVVDYFEPKTATAAPVLYNHGHIGNHLADDALAVIDALLADGHPVAAFTMPGRSPNLAPPSPPTARSGKVPLAFDHASLAYLETPEFSPLKLFVQPLVATVNWLKDGPDGPHADEIDAVGFSGGGWTVTVAAAVDPRIVKSFPVAGSLPLYLMAATPNLRLGDWEQLHPGLLARANFLEMYALGGAGAGRRQVQILNQFDCCFRGVGARDYAPVVAETAARLGGSYDLLLTPDKSHAVGAEALARIRAELR